MQTIIDLVQSLSSLIPLELFVFLGGIIEEVIAPIPSPVIMTFAGSLLYEMDAVFWKLVFIGVLGGIGKSLGSIVLYYLGYYLEVIFIEKYGNYFGLSKSKFEKYSQKITNLKYPVFWIALLRAAPFIPSAPFSGIFGILKFNFKNYFLGTLIGCIIRDVFYVFLGFYSFKNIDKLMNNFDSFDSFITLFLIVLMLLFFYHLRKKVDAS